MTSSASIRPAIAGVRKAAPLWTARTAVVARGGRAGMAEADDVRPGIGADPAPGGEPQAAGAVLVDAMNDAVGGAVCGGAVNEPGSQVARRARAGQRGQAGARRATARRRAVKAFWGAPVALPSPYPMNPQARQPVSLPFRRSSSRTALPILYHSLCTSEQRVVREVRMQGAVSKRGDSRAAKQISVWPATCERFRIIWLAGQAVRRGRPHGRARPVPDGQSPLNRARCGCGWRPGDVPGKQPRRLLAAGPMCRPASHNETFVVARTRSILHTHCTLSIPD